MARNPSSTNPLGVHSQPRVGDLYLCIILSLSCLALSLEIKDAFHHLLLLV
jgi:hypothetical protein